MPDSTAYTEADMRAAFRAGMAYESDQRTQTPQGACPNEDDYIERVHWDKPHAFRDVAAPESIRPVCYCGLSKDDWPHVGTRGGWGLNTWHETPADCEWCPEVIVGDEGVIGIADNRQVTAHRRCWREHFGLPA